MDAKTPSLVNHLARQVRTLHPAYFAMSMATGIVSIAGRSLGLTALSGVLFWVNVIAYCALWVVTLARLAFYTKDFLADWSSHQRGPGFFTTVAATSVLGVQLVLLRGDHTAGVILWWFGLALWAICTYAVFVALSVKEKKPSLEDGINGGWLLAVVATQSICVLGCNVIDQLPSREMFLFLLVSFWLCGGMLYIWMISLIFYRYTFFRFAPTDLMPPYWVNMGAVAISTLAGALLAGVEGSPLLVAMRPFIKGFTILYWATATWWIPMLLLFGIWRYGVRRIELKYDPLYWGLVFPLGMYSVATYRLSLVLELPGLAWVSRAFVTFGAVAWMLAFFGLASGFVYIALLALRSTTSLLQERSNAPKGALGGPQ